VRRRLPHWAHLVLLPVAALFATPFLWMLDQAFMSTSEINRFPPALVPGSLRLAGFRTVLSDSDFPRWFLNSAIVSLAVVVITILISALAGYAFARLRFVGSGLILALMIATWIVPFQLTMIPTFMVFHDLGLTNNLLGLIVQPLLGSVTLGVFMLRQFFVAIPRAIEEAALIDGASRLDVLFRVLLPLARPAIAGLSVLTFLTVWNDLSWPLIAIQDPGTYTIQLGLTTFQGQRHTDWGALQAANLMAVLPVMAAFLIAQRRFIQSLAATAVKG
jgi:multiple sugar transport system permease protein